MSRYHSYLNSAAAILSAYDGSEPFALFLKNYFAQHKKFGSRDRKTVSHLCYCFFRLGKAGSGLPVSERILLSLFICSRIPDEILAELDPDRVSKVGLSIEEKLEYAGIRPEDIFPWRDELSDGLDVNAFCRSFFVQPDVFLRLRPDGSAGFVREKLAEAGLEFSEIGEYCISLPPGSKVDEVLALDYEAMIQDMSSQRTGELMETAVLDSPLPFITAWDCCAASGGKSIMLFDIHEKLDLVVSDIRPNILENLKKRFKEHGIGNYEAIVADLSRAAPAFKGSSKFNLIYADVPCSGSGTWSRTPEQLYFFKEKKIGEYAALQRKILGNVVPALQENGYFLYITCSVFRKENEEQVEWLKEKFQLQLVKMELIKGYDKKADTMFAALLRKTL